tara:strand:+ start:5642 stop:5839 length:198 start_codon:yes stop_codon:yes gene_type:complete
MLDRIYARLEILGYSRAIGSMIGHPGITASHLKGLYEAREDAVQRLAKLKAEAKEERFGRTLSNA